MENTKQLKPVNGRLLELRVQLSEEILILRKHAVFISNKLESINNFCSKENESQPRIEPQSLLDEIEELLVDLRDINRIMKGNVEHIETII